MVRKRVIVGMSGGVDSSFTAALLKTRGYDVTGVTMRIWKEGSQTFEQSRNGCYGPNEPVEIEKTAAIADKLSIPFHVVDLADEYEQIVLAYFRREYQSGRTPNPCVICNRHIKFHFLVEKARQMSIPFDWFATGHYARIDFDCEASRYLLKRSVDEKKDQSYFLFALTQEQLGRTLFPLGDYHKENVREELHRLHPDITFKEESQDFAGCDDYTVLLRQEQKPGPILDLEGNVLGEHRGIAAYTIGQRRGIGIPWKEPLYVLEIDPQRNAIVVGERDKLLTERFIADEPNWIAFEALEVDLAATVKIRQQHQPARAVVTPLPDNRVQVRFDEPQTAVTPGQMAVFYDEDIVLGGGVISRSLP